MADSTLPVEDRRPEHADVLGDNNGSKYNVNMHVFPPDLAWLQQDENYVAFYINVPDKTAASMEDQVIGTVAPIDGTFQGGDSKLFSSGKPYKRLKTAIVLPIMERPTAKYSADWDMTSLGPVLGWAMTSGGGMGAAPTTMEGWGKAAWNMTKEGGSFLADKGMDALKAMGLSAINSASGLVGLGGEAGTKDIFSILSRTAMNEHRTQIFKSVRFRNFDFVYRFAPRDAQQANTIKTIIQTFKYHMHPEKADSNLFLTYPSEFDIVFYFKGTENSGDKPEKQNLFKISTCALTDFQVDYGGEKFFTFDDGMPIEITMQMSFMELELLTKERIVDGY